MKIVSNNFHHLHWLLCQNISRRTSLLWTSLVGCLFYSKLFFWWTRSVGLSVFLTSLTAICSCLAVSLQIFVCLQDVLKTSLRQGMSWRRLRRILSVTIFRLARRLGKCKVVTLNTSSRRLGDKQNVYWGYLYLTNLNLYLTNIYLINL